MSYGMAWAGSAPGPVSPRSWLEGIYDYAVKVMAVAPGVFLHDPHKLREELILRPARIFPQRLEDAVRAVVRH